MLFQSTIDTSRYMVAGYAIFFGVTIVYLLSLYARWKNLQRDLEALEELDE